MREIKIVESFNAAIEGFIYAMRTERNMRIHFLIGIFIVIFAIFLNFTKIELIILFITISFVLVAEMANSALELTVDLIKSEFHPTARVIKDVSAGAVLVSAVNAIIVGYILFSRKLPFKIEEAINTFKNLSWHATFVALIIVFSFTVLAKALLHRGTPLRGGMPSGHAAMAFAIWTIVSFVTESTVAIILVLALAVLVARSRVKDSVHSVWEVVAGAALGTLTTALIFQLLR